MTRLRHRITTATATSVSIAAIAAGCSSGSSDEPAAPANPSSTPPAAATARPGAASYRDGDYQAKGWYGGGPSSIDVALTLRAGRITAVQVTPNATNPTSLDYQERFAAAVPDVVVGRPIDEVRVSRLAGSSGTPDGFNDALEKIRNEASR
jgi:uncharacterized protein with FMN-binding domain